MKNIWAICKKEIKTYFTSPIAYVAGFVFLLLSGFFFYFFIMRFDSLSRDYSQNPYYLQELNINQLVYPDLFFWMSIFLLFVLPLLTMRLFSEEKKIGTDELLFTSPLSANQIILGKYFGSVFVLLVILFLSGIPSIFTFVLGNPELAPILNGYLGLFLMGAAFIAVGIFFSSLTDSQVISAVLAYGTLFFFLILFLASYSVHGVGKEIINYISFFTHFANMTNGILDTTDVVYYLSFIFIGLFLTHSVIQSRRWR